MDLGGEVRTGDVLARVHDVERTGASPVSYRAAIDGILCGRHFPGMIGIGDVIAVVAVPMSSTNANAIEAPTAVPPVLP